MFLFVAHLIKSLKDAVHLNVGKKVLLLKDKAQMIYALQRPNLKNFPWKYYVFNNYVIPPEVLLHDIEFSYGKLNPYPKVFTGPYNVSDLLGYARYVMESTFSEELSDNCLVEVVTASDNRKPHHCPVSKSCYDLMIKMPTSYNPHFPGYGVTHMTIYLQIARSRNCIFNKTLIEALVNQQCSYIFWELKKNVEFGYIPQLFDLFLQQISVCGLEGYAEFLQKRYLEHVLQQQNKFGGFGVKEVDLKELARKQRIKKESNRMMYGANNHTTGLATEVLALYIRFLLKKLIRNKVL
ncbi:hypothetical protein ILUMI_16320 [Ignelater luminosus]|uniref:Uncharacterized protein n=1 Tax=Ignelater luminosus TaxID=2038154 RepID=A0A8K0CM06_IGNLU|nr:hypothetical protein ILUMI_16320 [Ignelater luminosus]